jgi:hypothetical protein
MTGALSLSFCITSTELRAFSVCSGVYKRDGDASGPNCGPLSDAEKAELDKMMLEEIKAEWERVDPRKIKKAGLSSKYRGVCWCAICRGLKKLG